MRGKFIAIEGLEGAGKSSAIATIKQRIQSKGFNVVNTREPGGTPMAEAIRDCVKHNWQEQVSEQTELLLMYAARSQLVTNVIQPALDRGDWVLADRHDLSTVAYQGGGRQVSMQHLQQLRQLTLGDFTPDFTLYLDVTPQIGLERARGRGELDRIEQSGIEFFERVRKTYLDTVSKMSNAATINALQDINSVQSDVEAAIDNYLGSL